MGGQPCMRTRVLNSTHARCWPSSDVGEERPVSLTAGGRTASGASNTIDFAPPFMFAVQRASNEDHARGRYHTVNGGTDVLIKGVNFGVSMWSDDESRGY